MWTLGGKIFPQLALQQKNEKLGQNEIDQFHGQLSVARYILQSTDNAEH